MMKTNVFFLMVVFSFLLTGRVFSDTHYIKADGSGDFATIQDAVTQASLGDTIKLEAATFTGAGNVGVMIEYKRIVITGEAGSDETILDCEGAEKGFTIIGSDGQICVVSNLTIRNGSSSLPGGGIAIAGGAATIENVIIENCTAPEGGGIYITSLISTPLIEECIIRNCTATQVDSVSGGGGILVAKASPRIMDCDIYDNQAANGAGVLLRGEEVEGIIVDVSGIYSTNRIHHNSASMDGGGIKVLFSSERLEIAYNLIYENIAAEYGGGMFLNTTHPDAKIHSCTVAENTAAFGSALYMAGATARADYMIFAFNTAPPDYPNEHFAVFSHADILSYINCSIHWNPGVNNYLGVEQDNSQEVDPLFYGEPGLYKYYLQEDSPAAADNSQCGQQIGALGIYSGPVSVEHLNSDIPQNYILEQNYPNPFNPDTKITFGIPQSSKVLIEVYNVLGQKISTLFNGYKSAGYHVLNFNANGLPSGVYFYTIKVNNYQNIKKMALLK